MVRKSLDPDSDSGVFCIRIRIQIVVRIGWIWIRNTARNLGYPCIPTLPVGAYHGPVAERSPGPRCKPAHTEAHQGVRVTQEAGSDRLPEFVCVDGSPLAADKPVRFWGVSVNLFFKSDSRGILFYVTKTVVKKRQKMPHFESNFQSKYCRNT